MREHIEADEPFVAPRSPVAEAIERFAAQGADYKVELIEDLVRDEGVETRLALHATGPSPTSAAARTRPSTSRSRRSSCTGSPAPTGAATSTTRADPHLRHRLLHRGGPRRVPRAARAGAGARPPPARYPARPLPLLASLARARRSGMPNGTTCLERCSRTCVRPETAQARLRRGEDAADLRQRAVGRPPATGRTTARTCSSSRPTSASSALKPMNCPGALPASTPPSATPTATCRCAWPSRARAPATSRAGRCTGCCGCDLHPGRRPHLLHRGQIEDEVRACCECD